jgi:hypothetical protein
MNFMKEIARSMQSQFSQAVAKGLLVSLFSTMFWGSAAAQNAKPNLVPKAKQPPQTAEPAAPNSLAAYKLSNRRDPFFNPLLVKKNAKNEDEEVSRGTPPPGIGGTYIAQAGLLGISMRDNTKTAVVRGADARAYFLKEGDRLFDGYLKSIEDDSITLVRETKMRSGKILTQEVVKRLKTP